MSSFYNQQPSIKSDQQRQFEMLKAIKEMFANQYDAAFCTLNLCIDRCPEANWNAPVAKFPFCQVVFHTLFFADFYLGPEEAAFREQTFHRENASFFGDYEQLLDQEPTSLYSRKAIKTYLDHCRDKATSEIATESIDSLAAHCRFPRKSLARCELHVYNIRHIQHHAAQLTLRLRLDGPIDVPWVGSGWRDY